jgi:hypothetical protein
MRIRNPVGIKCPYVKNSSQHIKVKSALNAIKLQSKSKDLRRDKMGPEKEKEEI